MPEGGAAIPSMALELIGINRNTAILYFHKVCELIADKLTE
jgi:hypothetical protein